MRKKKSGGAAPYGYVRIDGGFALHPDEAPIRKLLFDLFLKHKKKLTVATVLNQKGYRTRSGAEFSDTSVTRLLIDPIVTGHHRENFVQGKGKQKYRTLKPRDERRYPELEPIISNEIWQQSQSILFKQKKNPAKKKPHGVLGGLLFCQCGSEMHHPYGRKAYFCKQCDNRIEVETLNEILASKLSDFVVSPDKLNHLDAQKDTPTQVEILRSEKEKIEHQMSKLEDLYLSENISKDRFNKRNSPLQTRLSSIQDELDFLRQGALQKQPCTPLDLGTAWTNANDDYRRELANLLIQNIEAGIASLKITFNISPSSL